MCGDVKSSHEYLRIAIDSTIRVGDPGAGLGGSVISTLCKHVGIEIAGVCLFSGRMLGISLVSAITWWRESIRHMLFSRCTYNPEVKRIEKSGQW